MRSILMRAMAIVVLCGGLVACDDIILPPDGGGNCGGGGNGGGGGDTVVTTGSINGVVVQDSLSPLEGLESARVAIVWHRADGTMRVGSITKLAPDLRFAFEDLEPLTAEDLLSDPTSSVEAYGIASIMLITTPGTQVGDIIDMRVMDPTGPMFTSITHDVIYRARGGAADPAMPWLTRFGAGFTLGLKGDITVMEYMPDPNGLAVVPVFGM